MYYKYDKLSKNQLAVIERALNFYGRFLAGQWRLPDDLVINEYEQQGKPDGFFDERGEVEKRLDVAKVLFFGKGPGWRYGIGNAGLHEDAKIAYDIGRPIMELFNKDAESWNVYSSPGMSYSKEGRVLPKEIEDND